MTTFHIAHSLQKSLCTYHLFEYIYCTFIPIIDFLNVIFIIILLLVKKNHLNAHSVVKYKLIDFPNDKNYQIIVIAITVAVVIIHMEFQVKATSAVSS